MTAAPKANDAVIDPGVGGSSQQAVSEASISGVPSIVAQESPQQDMAREDPRQDDRMSKSNGKADGNPRNTVRQPRSKTPPKVDKGSAFDSPKMCDSDKSVHSVKAALKAIGNFSAKTLQRPVDSLHTIGEAVKKKKNSNSPSSRRKRGYTSLPFDQQPFLRHRPLEEDVTTLESVTSMDSERDDNFIDNSGGKSLKGCTKSAPLPLIGLGDSLPVGPSLGNDSLLLTDTFIFWAVIVSILSLQLFKHWNEILQNHFRIGIVAGLMLLAFAVGLEIDHEAFSHELRSRFLHVNSVEYEETAWESNQREYYNEKVHHIDVHRQEATKEKVPLYRRIFRKRKLPKTKRKTFTTLSQRPFDTPPRKEDNATKNNDLMRRVYLFCSGKTANKLKSSKQNRMDTRADETPVHHLGGSQLSHASSVVSDISLGETTPCEARAVDLLEEVSTPLCEIRGLDLFWTEDADPEMITHPFLLQNGLRSVPTFVVNILTQHGNILVYFKLPDWVTDWSTCLVEKEDDAPDVVALKRFLKGDDEYKTKCFKVMPELVDGPYPVKLLTPHNRAFPLNFEGYISTIYAQEPPQKDECPVMSLTLDLVSNGTIRSMVGIFKRNMSRMTVDFACIIDPDEEGEPSCVLGLWRMDHLVSEEYPHLPDRYDEGDGGVDKADTMRSSVILKRLSESLAMQDSLLQAVIETSESL